MKYFLFSLIVVLTLTAGFNFYVDVENSYWRGSQSSISIPTNQVLVVPGNRNERTDRVKYLRSMPLAEHLILGSSRSIRWGNEEIALHEALTNLSVSTASLEEVASLYEAALQKNTKLKRLTLSLDPWMINENAQGFDAEWLESAGFLDTFKARVLHSATGSLEKKLKVRIKAMTEGLKSLLSYKRFFSSVQYIKTFGWNPPPQYILYPKSEKPEELYAIKSEGSLMYPKKYLEQSQEEADAQALQFPSPTTDYMFRNFTIDESKISVLKGLIQDAQEKGIEVVVISPPFHPITFERLTTLNMYKEAISSWQALLQALSQKIKVCDFTDPKTIGCQNQDFSDGMHMKPSCISAVFQKCQ